MNKLQSCEFEILKSFIEICGKLNLTYYLVCGSALGAAKYNGFIPWDDDIDVALPRADYEKFCEKANEMLPEPYFLQNYKTDRAFPYLFSKIRNSDTTYIEKSVSALNINHGVYIDVFPLDGYPSGAFRQRRLERKKHLLKLKLSCAFKLECKPTTKIFLDVLRLLRYDKRTDRTAEKLNGLISRYPTDNSELWCNHGNWQGTLEYAQRKQYGNGVLAEFEGIKVRIPERYDEYLTQKYGDWRSDPPENQKAGHHYYVKCDLDRPYTQYLEKLS